MGADLDELEGGGGVDTTDLFNMFFAGKLFALEMNRCLDAT